MAWAWGVALFVWSMIGLHQMMVHIYLCVCWKSMIFFVMRVWYSILTFYLLQLYIYALPLYISRLHFLSHYKTSKKSAKNIFLICMPMILQVGLVLIRLCWLILNANEFRLLHWCLILEFITYTISFSVFFSCFTWKFELSFRQININCRHLYSGR